MKRILTVLTVMTLVMFLVACNKDKGTDDPIDFLDDSWMDRFESFPKP
jgi:hypothetical protein